MISTGRFRPGSLSQTYGFKSSWAFPPAFMGVRQGMKSACKSASQQSSSCASGFNSLHRGRRMRSLLGKESLPAEGSPQQNRDTELPGEHRNTGVSTHMRTRFHPDYTGVNTCPSTSEKREARQKKKYKICPNVHLPVTAFRGQ